MYEDTGITLCCRVFWLSDSSEITNTFSGHCPSIAIELL